MAVYQTIANRAERMSSMKEDFQTKQQVFNEIKGLLPSSVGQLQDLCVDLLINQAIFEARCKVKNYMLLIKRTL